MENEKCVICFESIVDNAKGFWKKGNNAAPIAQGQCCDICNIAVVVTRFEELMAERKQKA
jgi:hypothetical protein